MSGKKRKPLPLRPVPNRTGAKAVALSPKEPTAQPLMRLADIVDGMVRFDALRRGESRVN